MGVHYRLLLLADLPEFSCVLPGFRFNYHSAVIFSRKKITTIAIYNAQVSL
jgi:hypothetical protein